MALTLCVLLHAVPGKEQQLVDYEDAVLALVPAHQGRVVQRVRSIDAPDPLNSDGPYEVHILEFADDAALDAYMTDPARVALADLRVGAIARTEVLRVMVAG